MQLLQSTEQIGMLNSISTSRKQKCMCELYSYLISLAFRRVFPHLERKSGGFQAKFAYWWAVTVSIWLSRKIVFRNLPWSWYLRVLKLLDWGRFARSEQGTSGHSAYTLSHRSARLTGLSWLISGAWLADPVVSFPWAQQSQLLPGMLPWIFAVTALTLRLMVHHWSIRQQKAVHKWLQK